MASLEMLKKLLDEFAEKEAHTREEINVVTQQIAELEQRVQSARTRQQGIAGDRDRLLEMKAHYAGGAVARKAASVGGVPLPVQTPQVIPTAALPPAPPLQAAPPPQPTQAAPPTPAAAPAPPPAAAAPAPAPVEAPPKPNRFDLLDLFSPNDGEPEPAPVQQAAPAPQPAPVPQPAPAPQPAAAQQPAPAPQPAAVAPESPKEEEDDTVKSINDALRGLFR